MTSIHIKTQTRIHTQQKRGFYWFGLGEQPGHSFYVLILRLGETICCYRVSTLCTSCFSHPSGVSTSSQLSQIGVRGGFVVGLPHQGVEIRCSRVNKDLSACNLFAYFLCTHPPHVYIKSWHSTYSNTHRRSCHSCTSDLWFWLQS
jgi:hypothetical protein